MLSSKYTLPAILALLSFLLFVNGESSANNNKFVPPRDSNCTWTNPQTGITYDFSAMRNPNSDYYLPKNSTPMLKWAIYLNNCGPLVENICNQGSAGCQVWDPSKGVSGKASMGQWGTQNWQLSGNGNPLVTFVGGNGGRHFTIEYLCDPSTKIGTPVFIGESPQLVYNFQWPTSYACGNDSCTDATSCDSCLSSNGCAWCLSEGSCMPSTELDSCGSWITNGNYCSLFECDSLSDCKSCTNRVGCEWCFDRKSCMDASTARSACQVGFNDPSLCPTPKISIV